MNGSRPAPGLPASWLNGWLAAVGTIVLVPDLRLSWTDGPAPVARFDLDAGDAATKIALALPTMEHLGRLAIARTRPDAREMSRKVTVEDFRDRVRLIHDGAVDHRDWSLEMSLTDLSDLDGDEVPHAPFDPSAPRGVTLHERLVTCRTWIDDLGEPATVVDASLRGRGQRVQANGLGFDYRRTADSIHGDSKVHVDPVIETLAFFGLQLFPFRGSALPKQQPRQRGFAGRPSLRHAFRWPCWHEPLEIWAVDALLDRFHVIASGLGEMHERSARTRDVVTLRRLGIHAVFASVYHQARGQADSYRAFASERIRL
jgi:hypothetical protein